MYVPNRRMKKPDHLIHRKYLGESYLGPSSWAVHINNSEMTIFLGWKTYLESEFRQKFLINFFQENENLSNVTLLQDIYTEKLWKGIPVREI